MLFGTAMQIFNIFFLVCLVFFTGTVSNADKKGAEDGELAYESERKTVPFPIPTNATLLKLLAKAAEKSKQSITKKPITSKPTTMQNKSVHLVNADEITVNLPLRQLKDIVLNFTRIQKNDTNPQKNGTVYEVKHYLTAEQKYLMLKINLLGIGFVVVHDIIPIPVVNEKQYTKALKGLLDRVRSVREESAKIAKHGTQNITLEDAHALHMKMNHNVTETPPAHKKTHTTEVVVLIGVIVGILAIGAMVWVCKRNQSNKPPDSYYDPLQQGGGLPMN